MIELEQIKTTDTIGQLRGQLNTAFNEIQSDQPFIGRVVTPSIELYNDGTLTKAITASELTTQPITALGFLESNGCFVWGVHGVIGLMGVRAKFNKIVIYAPMVKFATRTSGIATFVSPNHLGLSSEQDEWGLTGINTIAAGPATVRYTKTNGSAENVAAICLIEQYDAICNIIIKFVNAEAATNDGTIYAMF